MLLPPVDGLDSASIEFESKVMDCLASMILFSAATEESELSTPVTKFFGPSGCKLSLVSNSDLKEDGSLLDC